ncbi:MAG: glucosyl-3-phosphoglycerate synthase [Actinomycetota bacterium]|nr:glucosyl-3-phosphoglycerate synthase [Actinomycetota bacterium]
MTEGLGPELRDWFERRTIAGRAKTLQDVAGLKRASGLRTSVCLPALDEAETVGSICRTIRKDLIEPGIVDELAVVDSGSTDATRRIAAEAGADVYRAEDVLPGLPPRVASPGKGEAVWKGLAVTSGDLVVWVDSDIRDFSSHFISALLWPLLEDPGLVMTKGFYDRPLAPPRGAASEGDPRGGRVTELAARPLLQLLCPALGAVVQPLSGEYALRRSAAIEIPFVTGYGVDVALLVDVVARFGIDSLAQVDLGRRVHRNRDLLSLGRTSFQVVKALLERLAATGALQLTSDLPGTFTQFHGPSATQATADLEAELRPPMSTVRILR